MSVFAGPGISGLDGAGVSGRDRVSVSGRDGTRAARTEAQGVSGWGRVRRSAPRGRIGDTA
jgi:hypothetical protein